ncbi:MAG TPA: nitronate monooxygenase, partial [Polyangiaceae bacterium]|nr:nitronate monooxygenase [Polyangiaceae bacterium]
MWAHDIVVFCPPEDMELARSVVRAGALAVVDAVPTWHDETARGAALFCKTVEDVETCTVSALVLDDVALLENRRVDVPVAVRIRSSEEALEAAKRGASAVILGPGGEGTLVVAQQLRGRIAIPWLIESTSGPAASAAARVIGASGVVLNWRTAGDRLADLRGYFRRLRTECRTSAERAAHQRLLAEGAPFARKFHARFPIVQGPMTRVSDGATFARAVGQSGGVPTIALGVSAAAEVRATLEEVSRTCAGPWGVGLLGFVEGELLVTQMAEVVAAKPSVAIVAGTNADAVLELESQGIAAFMHLPSPRLLATFVRAGVRRFVFEGNECGGHIGPLSSLDLWGAAVEAIRGLGASAGELDVLAAGGIHDAMTAAVAAAVFADAAELGATFGVLMGTAYLFTREAVSTGAITALYQTLALRCEHTVLLESGPGHVVRVADTAWAHEFRRERARLVDECAGAESLKQRLESLGLGRLRLAAKGFVRSDDEIAPASLELQERQGSFMMGAVAT